MRSNGIQFKMRNVEMDYNCLIGILQSVFEFLIVIVLIYLINNKTLLKTKIQGLNSKNPYYKSIPL